MANQNQEGPEKSFPFRPVRFSSAKYFLGDVPEAVINGNVHILENVSQAGAAFSCKIDDGARADISRGDAIDVEFLQDGTPIFQGKAVCAYAVSDQGQKTLGVSFGDAAYDIEKIKIKNARAVVAKARKPSQDLPVEYRAICADLLDFVGDYSKRIDQLLTPYQDDLSSAEVDAFISEFVEKNADEWRSILCQGNAICKPLYADRKFRKIAKRYTENTVTPVLVQGESWARSFYKPKGYPGDYAIMNYMYDHKPEGKTVKQKFFHILGTMAGEPIVTRKNKLVELIEEHVSKKPDDKLKLTSIGCGPCRELPDLDRMLPRTADIEMWAMDQEVDALQYSMNMARKLNAQSDRSIDLKPIKHAVIDMANPVDDASFYQGRDIIYSTGMVDYFGPLLARRYVGKMYSVMSPGSMLVIGNVHDGENGTLWPMEFILDWSLHFRTLDDMHGMAAGIPSSSYKIIRDARDAVYFLVATKD